MHYSAGFRSNRTPTENIILVSFTVLVISRGLESNCPSSQSPSGHPKGGQNTSPCHRSNGSLVFPIETYARQENEKSSFPLEMFKISLIIKLLWFGMTFFSFFRLWIWKTKYMPFEWSWAKNENQDLHLPCECWPGSPTPLAVSSPQQACPLTKQQGSMWNCLFPPSRWVRAFHSRWL